MSKMPKNETVERDVHDRLLDAVEKSDLESFKRILDAGLENAPIDLKHIFNEPYLGTILDVCCMLPGKSEFVEKLLSAGVDVNLPNKFQNKNAIHMAAGRGHVDVLRALIDHPSTEVGILDGDKNSALYHAIQNGHVACFELLFKCEAIDPNRLNRRGTNAVFAAATLAGTKQNDELMLAFIRCPRVDLDKIVWDVPLRETIAENYPHLKDEMPAAGTRIVVDKDAEDPFLLYLHKNDVVGFISHITSHSDQIERDDGKFSMLQYACHYGLPEVVKVLLDLGADPNRTSMHHARHPIFIASYRGFADIIKSFLDSGKSIRCQTEETNVLLEVIKGSSESHVALGVNKHLCDHGKSIELLLKVDYKYDINLADFKGNTCLHYAAIGDNREYIFSLLDHGAYLGCKNYFGHPPLNELSRSTFESYLNKCVSSNELSANDLDYEIVCSYKFLCPPKVYASPNDDDNDNRIRSKTRDVVVENIPETDPLLYMSNVPELRPLLVHPVLTNFLHLKWHKIRIYYKLNLAFFIGFLLALTEYIFLTSNSKLGGTDPLGNEITYYLWFVVLGFVTVMCFRELFQIISFPISYITSVENWLEICLIALISVLLCEEQSIDYRVSVSAIVLLMSWSEFILLLGKHPMFTVQLEMFKCVTKNFISFLLWYSFICFAFVLSFYVLFNGVDKNNKDFENFSASCLKTIIMVAGEYDSPGLPFQKNPIVGRLLFLLFVFLITLVLINLLSGLAVSDTQEIITNADIVAHVSRVNFIHSAETLVTRPSENNNSNKNQKRTNRLSCNIFTSWTEPYLRGLKLFPKALENPYIKILPNRGNLVDFGPAVKKSSLRCIANFQNTYLNGIDGETVSKAKEIIKLNSEEPIKSVNEIINEFIEKLNGIEKAVKGITELVMNKKALKQERSVHVSRAFLRPERAGPAFTALTGSAA